MAHCSNTEVVIRSRVRSGTSRKVGELRSPKFHIQYIVYDPTVGRGWESYYTLLIRLDLVCCVRKRMDERKQLKARLIAAVGDEHDMLEF